MKFKLEDSEIKVYFNQRKTRTNSHGTETRITQCMILVNNVVRGHATVGHYYKDQFSKFKGKREALTKALADMNLGRVARTIFWEQFRSQFLKTKSKDTDIGKTKEPVPESYLFVY